MKNNEQKLITSKNINNNIKIRIFNAIILSILLYGIHIIPLTDNSINKIQSFYLKCLRYIINENYDYKNPQKKLKLTMKFALEIIYQLYKAH